MKFRIIFIKKTETNYTVVNGFSTRQAAYNHISDCINDVDYYRIELQTPTED